MPETRPLSSRATRLRVAETLPPHARRFGLGGRFGLSRLFGLAFAASLAIGPPAVAESTLRLAAPDPLEAIRATTFDDTGHAIGRSRFEIETTADGAHRMRVDLASDTGARNFSEALLAPIAGSAAGASAATLQLVEQRSQSTTADGRQLPLLVIDHRAGRVSCYPDATSEAGGRHVPIPDEDRIVNVPMQLFFLPLVRGETDALRFQIATCGDGPKVHSMIAVRDRTLTVDGRHVVEIEYGPDFGKAVAWLASRLLPSFSFWFDADDGAYLGHRMPLHREGPRVTLVRQGLTPRAIGVTY